MTSRTTSEKENPPKAILFDIGRVIVRLDLARAAAPIAAALAAGPATEAAAKKAGPDQIWKAIESAPRWHDWQEGRMTPEQWHEYITAHLGIRVGFTDFCAAWNSALDPHTALEDEFFAKLAASHGLGLLSNTDPIHVSHLERNFSFLRYFPVRVYSCAVGASKPNPAIYQAALEGLGEPPGKVLYIDDVDEFVTAARQLGMDAIQFQDVEQVRRDLERRGVRLT